MIHGNAPLTPVGRRRLAVLIVEQGRSMRRAAERFQCSPATASRWAKRYRAGMPLTDRSSRPRHSPSRLSRRTERRIVALRFTRRWGPHRIGYHLRIPRSTVGRALARYRMPLLVHLDQATGLPVRRPKPVRYEMTRPGELVADGLRLAHGQARGLVEMLEQRHAVAGQGPPDRGARKVQVVADPVWTPAPGEPQRHDPSLGVP
jgi:transposase